MPKKVSFSFQKGLRKKNKGEKSQSFPMYFLILLKNIENEINNHFLSSYWGRSYHSNILFKFW